MKIAENEVDDIRHVLDETRSEHEQLIDIVEKIRDAIRVGDVAAATESLMQLQVRQEEHFQHEVAQMEKYGYPQIRGHEVMHQKLVDSLYGIIQLINVENLRQLNGELGDYLEHSLKHIIEVDKPLQDFLLATAGKST